MIQAGENNLIVKISTKYISNFTDIMKVAAIQNNTSINIEDIVNIQGEIVSLPRTICKKPHYKGMTTDDMKVGDNVIFSFSVVSDFYQKEPEGEPLYKNLINYKGQEYWKADITRVFAVVRDGEIIMVNGYVMADVFPESKIILQATSKRIKGSKSSELMHIGNPKTHFKQVKAKSGDKIYFNPGKVQQYQINNKPFVILQQQQILGVEV